MLKTINKNTLREQILYEVNNSKPEILELFYNYIQIIKSSIPKKETKTEKHHLLEFAGMLTFEEGEKMINCINQEFNKIEENKR